MTKNALLKRGPKNMGMGRPPQPYHSGNARKKTFFFSLRPSLRHINIYLNTTIRNDKWNYVEKNYTHDKVFLLGIGKGPKMENKSFAIKGGGGLVCDWVFFWPKNVLVYFENGKWKRVPLAAEGVHFLGCLATKKMTSCGIIKKRIKILRWAKDDKKTLQVSWILAWVTIWHLESEMNKKNVKRRKIFRRKAKDDEKGS